MTNSKILLKKSMKNSLPNMILERNDKIGFETPQEMWFKTKIIKDFISKILFSESFNKRPYFNHAFLKNMFIKQKKQSIQPIWKSVCLELWFREFID